MSPHSALHTVRLSAAENDQRIFVQVSPKRSYSLHEDNSQCADVDSKRRHLRSASEKRPPFDPITASELQIRRTRLQGKTVNDSNSRSLNSAVSLPDFRAAIQQQQSSEKSYEMIYSSSSSSFEEHTWPPKLQVPSDTTSVRNHGKHCSSGSSQIVVPPRAADHSLSPAWPPPALHVVTPSISEFSNPQGWDPSAFTPGDGDDPVVFRPRSNSLPLVRRPPIDLWQAQLSSTTEHRSAFLSSSIIPINSTFDTTHTLDPTLYHKPPPGIPPRSDNTLASPSTGPSADTLSATNASLVKHIPPIGTERSRVVPMRSPSLEGNTATRPSTPFIWSSSVLHSPTSPDTHRSSSYVSQDEQIRFNEEKRLSTTELNRLFRLLQLNPHSPKTVSPLNPLRNPKPDLVWSAQTKIMQRTVSFRNDVSSRYRQSLEARSRTICDRYIPGDLEANSSHCAECRRDTMHKKLLTLRTRQAAWPRRLRDSSLAINTLTTCQRGPAAAEPEEEGVNLWAELSAVTSDVHLFSPTAPRLHDLHDFEIDLPEIPDEDLFSDNIEDMTEIILDDGRALF